MQRFSSKNNYTCYLSHIAFHFLSNSLCNSNSCHSSWLRTCYHALHKRLKFVYVLGYLRCFTASSLTFSLIKLEFFMQLTLDRFLKKIKWLPKRISVGFRWISDISLLRILYMGSSFLTWSKFILFENFNFSIFKHLFKNLNYIS